MLQIRSTRPELFDRPARRAATLVIWGQAVARLLLIAGGALITTISLLLVWQHSAQLLASHPALRDLQLAGHVGSALGPHWREIVVAVLSALGIFILLLRLMFGASRRSRLRDRAGISDADPSGLLSHWTGTDLDDQGDVTPAQNGAATNGNCTSHSSERAALFLAGRSTHEAGDQASVDDLIAWAKEAARVGDRVAAYTLLDHAVQLAPTRTDAWLWLAGTCEEPEQVRRCLEQVVALDPDNQAAKRGLAQLES